jgi:hypothetical protein
MPLFPADRFRGPQAALLILALLLLPGCDGDKKGAPADGDKKGAPTEGGTPADAAGADSETPATPQTPAHLAQALAVIDLRDLPTPNGAKNIEKIPQRLSFMIPRSPGGGIETVVDFYRTKLTDLGWKVDPKLTTVMKIGGAVTFVKNGFVLYASIGGPADGDVNVGIFHIGNIDARTFPRPPGITVTGSLPSRIMYSAATTPDELQKFFRTEIPKLPGWREYSNPRSNGEPREDVGSFRLLRFINNAIKVEVSLYAPDAADGKKPAVKKPEGPAKTDVMVTMSLAQQEIPVPPNAEDLEIAEEGYPLFHHFYTKAKIAAVIEFYKKEMPAPWKLRDAAAKADDKKATLAFDAAGQEPLRLECVRDKDDVITAVRWTRWPKEGK